MFITDNQSVLNTDEAQLELKGSILKTPINVTHSPLAHTLLLPSQQYYSLFRHSLSNTRFTFNPGSHLCGANTNESESNRWHTWQTWSSRWEQSSGALNGADITFCRSAARVESYLEQVKPPPIIVGGCYKQSWAPFLASVLRFPPGKTSCVPLLSLLPLYKVTSLIKSSSFIASPHICLFSANPRLCRCMLGASARKKSNNGKMK